MKPLLALVLLVFSLSFAGAAEAEKPEPYGPDEFSGWQQDLRRAEILSFGALPFVTFFSSIYYDVWRYYDHDQDEGYLPWPFKNSDTAVPLSEDEQKKVFFTSIGISIGVAVVDFAWQTIQRSRKKKEIRRQLRDYKDPIVVIPVNPEESVAPQ